MTRSKDSERARQSRPPGASILAYAATELEARARALGAMGAPVFPMVQYQTDQAGFFRNVLGIALMLEQLEIAEAIRDHRRVAVSGGRKVGKDFVLAAVAIWFFCCFPGARVRFTAVTASQVQDVFWRELGSMLRGAGRCLECKRVDPFGPKPCPHSVVITEEVPILARTGIRTPDGRELVGYTAAESASVRGISGGYQLAIVDEASDVDDPFIEAVEGNMLGCVVGRLALISNPEGDDGQFYRAFHTESGKWVTFYRDSLEIARKYGGKIPGIVRLEELLEFIEKHGADSDLVTVHVHGRFVENAQGKAFPIGAILKAWDRHDGGQGKDLPITAAAGPLYVGVDVGGESGAGDPSAFACRRGLRCLGVHEKRGMSPEEHLPEVLRLIGQHPVEDPTLRPIIAIDRGGEVGAKVWGVFVAYLQTQWQDPPFRIVGVDSSRKGDKYQRNAKAFDRVRDELVGNLADWMRSGGAIPRDPKLGRELNEFRWDDQRIGTANKLIDKKKMREALGGSSPDLADALALACWVERHWAPPTAEAAAAPAPAAPADLQEANAIWYGAPQPGDAADAGDDPWWPKG